MKKTGEAIRGEGRKLEEKKLKGRKKQTSMTEERKQGKQKRVRRVGAGREQAQYSLGC